MTKSRNFIILFLVILIAIVMPACGSSKPGQTYGTVEQAEKARAKDQKAAAKVANKQKKADKKAFWARQSKEARKRVKKTEKEMKKAGKQKKRKRGVF